MYISFNEIGHAQETVQDIRSIDEQLNSRDIAIEAVNKELQETANILFVRPPIALAKGSIRLSGNYDVIIGHFIARSSYRRRRRAMTVEHFANFAKQPIEPYALRLSNYGKQFLLPTVEAFKPFSYISHIKIEFKFDKNLSIHSMNEYGEEKGTLTHALLHYLGGTYSENDLSLTKAVAVGSNTHDSFSGIPDFYPFWEQVSTEIHQALPLTLLKADTYVEQTKKLNETLKEILFPLYAKRELFNRLESK
jgi:hypothetical protein